MAPSYQQHPCWLVLIRFIRLWVHKTLFWGKIFISSYLFHLTYGFAPQGNNAKTAGTIYSQDTARILLMGRRNCEWWQHIPGNIHVYLFWLVSNCYSNIYFTVGSYWIHAAQLSIFIMVASLLHLGQSYHCPSTNEATLKWIYRQVSNIRRTLVGNKIVDHSDVVRASPVGAAPTTSSFST